MWLTHSIFSLFGESWISRDPNGSNEIQTLTLPTARPLLPPGAVFELEGGGKLPGAARVCLAGTSTQKMATREWITIQFVSCWARPVFFWYQLGIPDVRVPMFQHSLT